MRQRSHLTIDRHEAIRLMHLAAVAPDIDECAEIHGRDSLSGTPATVALTWRQLVTAPEEFLPPA